MVSGPISGSWTWPPWVWPATVRSTRESGRSCPTTSGRCASAMRMSRRPGRRSSRASVRVASRLQYASPIPAIDSAVAHAHPLDVVHEHPHAGAGHHPARLRDLLNVALDREHPAGSVEQTRRGSHTLRRIYRRNVWNPPRQAGLTAAPLRVCVVTYRRRRTLNRSRSVRDGFPAASVMTSRAW
jgi:hypothetical protein